MVRIRSIRRLSCSAKLVVEQRCTFLLLICEVSYTVVWMFTEFWRTCCCAAHAYCKAWQSPTPTIRFKIGRYNSLDPSPLHRTSSIPTAKMATASKSEDQLAVAKNLNHVPWCEQYEQMISGMLYGLLARNKPMSFH